MKLLLLGRGVEDNIEYLAEAAHKVHRDALTQIVRQRLVILFVCKRQDDLGNPRALAAITFSRIPAHRQYLSRERQFSRHGQRPIAPPRQ